MPYFGIWKRLQAQFICLEPWAGIADSTNHTGLLTQKEGIIQLVQKQQFECGWEVGIF
jgi:galactose mutarotase-like enzyme